MIDLLQAGVLERCRTLPHSIDAEQLRAILEAYRGGLNVEGYRQRHDGFTAGTHDDLRAVLAAYLAHEDAPHGPPPPPRAITPPRRLRGLVRWLRRNGSAGPSGV
jgi:hypothetical protein